MTQDVLYQLENIAKDYGERQVLQIDDLTIARGEVLAVVGPSGAGKSTLLRLLNFLEVPTHGRIQFQGCEFSANQPMPLRLRRQVTTVFQRPFLLNRSVSANVRYGLRLRGRRDDARAVEIALEQVGLTALARQPARTLSGGEAQRVALARALVVQPDVLLLDEPTANLDPQNIALIEKIITDLNRRQGTTLVLVTHNIFQAKRLAKRTALMMDGRLVETAVAETFFNNPTDPRTAAFIQGDMVY
ncbi:MAG: phosphate ABC transporter ATP-binding protein [Chloroflexi bacterium]|nr:phosphate ABC transporter ATP-binding protein [Chloroflexota bacterium]